MQNQAFEIAKTFKVRGSVAIIIPKKIAESLNLKEGQYVKVSTKNGEVVITKIFQIEHGQDRSA
jgi:AbrB family looped-hinge helix DNA binding protein